MLIVILLILIALWFLGYIDIRGLNIPDYVLFQLNGRPITLWNVLIFFVVLAAIGILPSPFREIAGVLFALWLLTLLGILAISGLGNLLVIAIIIGIVASFVF